MQPIYTLNDNEHKVTPLRRNSQITLDVDGHSFDARLHWHDAHHGEITINGAPHEFYAAQDDNKLFIHFDGKVWNLTSVDEFSSASEGADSAGAVTAPMPGVVVEVYAPVGSRVEEGDAVLIIESMKLQTEIKAAVSGVVKTIGAQAGASFDKGAVLIDIDADEATES
ncbi:hypothetical protein HBA55_23370 [Pseudomaricurvus alkylphenolicus]|jgi:biotin carboxyl carrier protein|uniref:acetyl-CoA carboxylase biotin carboxyl carrier protein subunit n=1 Tax=Pseudomaricurvus alkylphenolicus TaxID=1306991 RepID=UPI00142465C8|nr:acetyl-CoA carboxylase biotin carboxyl carrier protein subunit [Pseudomaricurvus alkylphenolicus]NIB42568.1 hypothetical protein [Pseudomaricurvus alkylphenolicus]